MFDLIALIVVNVVTEVLFYVLVYTFYLSVGLGIERYYYTILNSDLRHQVFLEVYGEELISIYDEFSWNSEVTNYFSLKDPYYLLRGVSFVN